jgi:hypothetical protein
LLFRPQRIRWGHRLAVRQGGVDINRLTFTVHQDLFFGLVRQRDRGSFPALPELLVDADVVDDFIELQGVACSEAVSVITSSRSKMTASKRQY